MNWYKTEYLNAVSSKYAADWASMGKGFLAPLIIGGGLLTLIMQSGVSNEELVEIAEKNNRNVPAIRQELENKVKSMGHPIDIDRPKQPMLQQTQNQQPVAQQKRDNLKETILNELINFEGSEEKIYPDPLHSDKIPTIGIGFNLNNRDVIDAIEMLGRYNIDALKQGKQTINFEDQKKVSNILIDHSFNRAKNDFPNFNNLNPEAQSILVQMEYQMGGLSHWNKLRAALNQNPPDYQIAADEMLDSKWAKQLRGLLDDPKDTTKQTRAEKLAERMRNIR